MSHEVLPEPPAPANAQPVSGYRRRTAVMATVAVVALVGLVVAVALIVRDRQADRRAEERAAERKAQQAAAEAARLDQARALYDSCIAELGEFRDALRVVAARLDVGLSQGELSRLVGKASIAYSGIEIEALGEGGCISAGAKLEGAFNDYNGTVSTWNDCIVDWDCSMDSIEADLQANWLKADNKINKADAILDSMDPEHPTYDPAVATEL